MATGRYGYDRKRHKCHALSGFPSTSKAPAGVGLSRTAHGTLYALLAYRIGCYIPVPGIDPRFRARDGVGRPFGAVVILSQLSQSGRVAIWMSEAISGSSYATRSRVSLRSRGLRAIASTSGGRNAK